MTIKSNQSSRLKVVFITTSNAGIAFYRMWQFHEEIKRQKMADVATPWFHYDNIHAQEWEWHVHDDFRVYSDHEKLGVIAPACKWADVVVVQYLHTFEALCLIEALKAYTKIMCPQCLHVHGSEHVCGYRKSDKHGVNQYCQCVCSDQKDTPFLTEIDDDVLDTPTHNAAFDAYAPGSRYRDVVVEQLKALDGVVCSTPYLAEKYKEFNPYTYVVPNCLDIPKWDKVEKFHAKDEVRIGWAGGASHDEDLRTIEAPLKRFLAEHKKVSFHIVHGIPDFFRNQSKVVCHKWWAPINKYPRHLGKMGFDIGLAPLKPGDFNLGKSNLRKLEYGGLRIPVLAQNIGEFARTVHHGKDGFLYNNADEFYKFLELLYSDAQLRRKMGEANYQDIKDNFNVEKIAPAYLDILRAVKERGQTTTIDVSDHRARGNQWTAAHA